MQVPRLASTKWARARAPIKTRGATELSLHDYALDHRRKLGPAHLLRGRAGVEIVKSLLDAFGL
jgi:hypothetical protein